MKNITVEGPRIKCLKTFPGADPEATYVFRIQTRRITNILFTPGIVLRKSLPDTKNQMSSRYSIQKRVVLFGFFGGMEREKGKKMIIVFENPAK